MRRAWLLALGALVACGPSFYEPNPPELTTTTRTWSTQAVDQRVAYALVVDFYGGACSYHSSWLSLVRAEMQKRDPGAVELALINLSPGCNQSSSRSFDPTEIETVLEQLSAAEERPLRGVVLYVNNVDLDVPVGVANGFAALATWAEQKGRPAPLVWGITAKRVHEQLHFDQWLEWTFSGDTELAQHFADLAAAELPLRSRTMARDIPLLDAAQLAKVQALKVCAPPANVEPIHFALDGTATFVSPDAPPTFQPLLPALDAVPRSQYSDLSVSIPLELCTAHCDRFLEQPELRGRPAWSQFPGCVTGGP